MIEKIENLEKQENLCVLHLHENAISKIENLQRCKNLTMLNLSKNFVSKVENLSHLSNLTTLILSHNNLTNAESIVQVQYLQSLQVLDIQFNKVNGDDYKEVIKILHSCQKLRVLYLLGNGIVKKIPHYRKTIISSCPELKYLDNRPVFHDERRRGDKWGKMLQIGFSMDDALQAEKEEMEIIRREKKKIEERKYLSLNDIFLAHK